MLELRILRVLVLRKIVVRITRYRILVLRLRITHLDGKAIDIRRVSPYTKGPPLI